MAGQGLEPTGGYPRQVEFRDAQGTDLFEPLQGGDQGRAAHPGRGTSEPVQVALACPLGHDQQRLQPLTLHGVGGGGEDAPEAGRRPIRAWATTRARTVTPGSKTLRSTSQAVARSNSRLGRSALTQARA